MFKLVLEKGKEPEIKLPTPFGLLKTTEFQKNIYFFFIDYANTFDCVDHNKLWKIIEEMVIPYHLTCLMRNLYASQKATVMTWKNRLVTNWERSMSRLYIVTLLI